MNTVYIFTDHIKLDIYQLVYLQIFQVRMFKCVGDNSHRETFAGYIKESKANTINADRSFFYYK